MVTWTDNSIGAGSIVATINSGNPTASTAYISSAVFDDVTLNMPGIVIQRTDEVGKDNGFALIANSLSTAGGPPVTGTATVQIPTSTSGNQLCGKWFGYDFDTSTGGSTACFVITSATDVRGKDGYWKVNIGFQLSRTPPTA
jgi:hypothetical protein